MRLVRTRVRSARIAISPCRIPTSSIRIENALLGGVSGVTVPALHLFFGTYSMKTSTISLSFCVVLGATSVACTASQDTAVGEDAVESAVVNPGTFKLYPETDHTFNPHCDIATRLELTADGKATLTTYTTPRFCHLVDA